MSAHEVGKVLDVLATIFGVGVSLGDIFGQSTPSIPNVVRIYVGEQWGDDKPIDVGGSPGGNAPGVTIWDTVGKHIGTKAGEGKIGPGSFKDYAFDTGTDERSASYLSVSAAGSDGICIPAITLSTPSNNNFAWFGDVGRFCGAPWYPSAVMLGTEYPSCVWIDTNADKGHKYNGLSVHIGDFFNSARQPEESKARKDQQGQDHDLMCKSKARFTMWDEIIPENDIFIFRNRLEQTDGLDTEADRATLFDPAKWVLSETGTINGVTGTGRTLSGDASPCFGHADDCHPSGPSCEEDLKEQPSTRRRRQLHRRQDSGARIMPNHLRISAIPSHSAREVCEDSASEGPDFISLVEGLFCDMSTLDNRKQLYPLCSDAVTTNCFDMSTHTLIGASVNADDTPPYSSNSTVASNSTSSSGAYVKIAAAISTMPTKNYTNVQRWG